MNFYNCLQCAMSTPDKAYAQAHIDHDKQRLDREREDGRMTSTPLFHETARQLWVNGQISRPALDRLVNHVPAEWPQLLKFGCDCLIPNNPANLERNREIIRKVYADGRIVAVASDLSDTVYPTDPFAADRAGLNARLDRLG